MVQVHIARESGFKKIEFLLLKRSGRQAIYPGIWQVITGKRKEGETFTQCALREILEETGCVPTELWALPFVATFFIPQSDSIVHSPVFGALICPNANVVLSGEHSELVWAGENEVMKMLVMPSHRTGTEFFLKEVLQRENREMFKIPAF